MPVPGATGLVYFDSEGERAMDYSVYDLQYPSDEPKFVPVLNFDSQSRTLRSERGAGAR